MFAAASLFGLGLATTVAFLPGIVNVSTAPRWAVLATLIPICLLLGRREAARAGWWITIFLACALTLAWTPDALDAVDNLVHVAILLAAFHLGATTKSLRPVWGGIEIGICFCAGFVLLQLLGWEGLPQTVKPGGLFMNKNMMAEAAMVAAITALIAGSFITLAAATFVLAATFSKAAIGATLVACALWLAPKYPRIARGMIAAIVLALVAFFAFGWPSAVVRMELWKEMLGNLALFGHGLGSFSVARPDAFFAHSEPLQLVYELGLLALPILAVLIYALGEHEHQTERLVLVAVVATSTLSFPLHLPLTAFAAALAAGHLVGARDRVRLLQHEGRTAFGFSG